MEYGSVEEFKEQAGYVIEGAWYPRVTSIVSIKAKPALYRYYGGMPSYRAADIAKERSAAEGTLVHEAVEAIFRGQSPALEESIRPSVDAFIEFCRNNNVTPLLIEERIRSKHHHYAGTVDAVAEINGVIGVLDIKTSGAIYRDYGMQTAAYMQALQEDTNLPHPTTSWILRLDQCRPCELCSAVLRTKGGTFRVRGRGNGCTHRWGSMEGRFEFQELSDYDHNIKAFLAAKTLWEWEHKELLQQLL